MKLGIDTGGTFTDLIGVDSSTNAWYTAKVPSTPGEPLVAILDAIDTAQVDLGQVELLILGTTVGTNALLERKGARVAFLTTQYGIPNGFRESDESVGLVQKSVSMRCAREIMASARRVRIRSRTRWAEGRFMAISRRSKM